MEFLKIRTLPELMNEVPKIKNKIYFLAGGTDLMVLYKDEMINDDSVIIDINELNELKYIKLKDDQILIGALTTFTEILESNLLKRYSPVLISAVSTIGSPQIRNIATIGGNVANASPAGDSIPALFIHNTKIITTSGSYNISEFFKGVKSTILSNGELIKEFQLERLPAGTKVFFYKSGPRKALAISKASFAMAVKLKNKKISFIRIAAGAVAKTVVRTTKTENLLINKNITNEIIEEAKNLIKTEISPITDFRSTENYRREIISYYLEKSLKELIKL